MHPGTRLKALQGSSIRKHPAIKPTSSTSEGMTGVTQNLTVDDIYCLSLYKLCHTISNQKSLKLK